MGKIRRTSLERNQEIKDEYLTEIKTSKNIDDVIDSLSARHDIGKFYVRNILKDQGIEIGRKSEYSKNLSTRNSEIIEKFHKNVDPALISAEYDLTITRVRQIIRDALGKVKVPKLDDAERIQLERYLTDITKALDEGVLYSVILEKYGKQTIKNLKINMGFNVFKYSLKQRVVDMVRMAKAGKDASSIAFKHSLTRSYVYTILNGNGVHCKITDEEKQKRDDAICKAKAEGKSVEKIATKHHLTPTMVRIILSERKIKDAKENKDKENSKGKA